MNAKKLKLVTSLLLIEVFIASVCSLVYELLISTSVSNITGNSVLSFSLSIGLFLAGLGTGAYLTKFFKDSQLADGFILVETLLAMIGGFSVISIYLAIGFTPYFRFVQVLLTFSIGLLSGFEIPILTRFLNTGHFKNSPLKNILAEVLSFDYFGGLLASLLFPIILLPYFGLVRLSFLTGVINLSMAILSLCIFWNAVRSRFWVIGVQATVLLFLVLGTIFSANIYNFAEAKLYQDPIVYSTQTQYQRVVITQKDQRTRLYLNGSLQFNSLDEYRYHQSLILPGMLNLRDKSDLKIAVLGGGDGLAVNELLKFESLIEKIYLVDIDPVMTELSINHNLLAALNKNSLTNPKVEVINQDAQVWLQDFKGSLDFVVADFPDPSDTPAAKLYSREFYKLINSKLSADGIFVTQSSGALSSPAVFWGINKTMSSVFGKVIPYLQYVPSFGLWGFNLFTKEDLSYDFKEVSEYSSFFSEESLKNAFLLPLDVRHPRNVKLEAINIDELKINTLDNLILVNYSQIQGVESFN